MPEAEELIPMRLYDSHCHLQDERLLPQAVAVLARARDAGVEGLLCCGSAEEDWADVAALAHVDGRIVPAFGLHPWYARDRTAQWLETLAGFLKAEPRAAVGEIGLDHALKERNDEEQGEVFLAQLRLACGMGRAVSIHCRRAWGQLMQYDAALRALPRGFAVHSYSGAKDLIAPLAQAGAFFSFSGSVTWSHNTRSHEACRNVPADRLLIETDAPDLMPSVAEGKPVNEPANLVCVLRKVAELRGETTEVVAEQTRANAWRLFGDGRGG